jgi:hypothetical protein
MPAATLAALISSDGNVICVFADADNLVDVLCSFILGSIARLARRA